MNAGNEQVDMSGEIQICLKECGMDPVGWMLFDSDYLHRDVLLQEGETETRQRETDRYVSDIIRQQCLPVVVFLLHEVSLLK